MIHTKKFEVGDIVIKKHVFGESRYIITRLTKTQAISDSKNYSIKFRIEYQQIDNSNQIVVRTIGSNDTWRTCTWFIQKKGDS